MEAFAKIRGWAADRNLIEGSDSFRQFVKLAEEVGELADGIETDNPDEIMDGIGDALVVLTILAAQNGMDIEDCIVAARIKIARFDDRALMTILTRENGKIAHGIAKGRRDDIRDGIGNAALILDALAGMNGFDINEDCVEAAWNEIKDRRGRMVNGVFVKEGD